MHCGTSQTAPDLSALLATPTRTAEGTASYPVPFPTTVRRRCVILARYSAKQSSTRPHPPSYSAKPIASL